MDNPVRTTWPIRALRGEIRWVWLGLHLLVIAGLLLTLVATWFAQGYFTRGVAAGADLTPIPYTDINPMGVNTFLNEEADPENVERSLDMIADGGFGSIRQIFGWYEIEPEPGVYIDRFGNSTWEKYDRIVDLATERGIEIIARLEKPPRWAREGQPNVERFPDGPPNEMADWINFVATVVERYEGRITFFQLWNEPNLEGEWGGLPIDARHYVDLLQAGYEAAKEANPESVILLAGLAPTEQRGPTNLSDLLFLQEVYDYGGAAYFDIAAVMVYGYGYSPFDRRVEFERNNFSRPIQTREIMVRNGDAHKPIWAVEYGWVSLPEDWQGEASPWGEPVTAEQQADYLLDGYLRAQREWPWMGVMAVWGFRWVRPDDHPDEERNPTRGFALVEHDFTPRPAFKLLREAAPRIQLRHTGAYDLPVETRQAANSGQRIEFQMAGSRLDVRIDGGSGGYLAVTVDGERRDSVTIGRGENQRVTAVDGLTDAPHLVTLQIQSEPSDDPPALSQAIVLRRPVHAWIYPLLRSALAVMSVVVTASLAWGFWHRRARASG